MAEEKFWHTVATTNRLFADGAAALLSGDGRSGVMRSSLETGNEDVYVVLYISVWFFIATWIVRKLTIEPLARYILPKVTGDAVKLEDRTQKFGQSAIEGLTYGAFSYFGYIIVLSQDWVFPAHQWFGDLVSKGPGSQHSHYEVDSALSCYVMCYLGRYFSNVVSLFLEARRKDFWQMLVHHVSTCFLVWTAYFGPWIRIGSVIMVLLDPADVPLHVAKLLKYMSATSKGKVVQVRMSNMCDGSFGLFAISFALMRIVCYPYVVWQATIGWDWKTLPNEVRIGIGLLYILLGLQAYWFYLIASIVIKVLRGGQVEDSRSDSDECDMHDKSD